MIQRIIRDRMWTRWDSLIKAFKEASQTRKVRRNHDTLGQHLAHHEPSSNAIKMQ